MAYHFKFNIHISTISNRHIEQSINNHNDYNEMAFFPCAFSGAIQSYHIEKNISHNNHIYKAFTPFIFFGCISDCHIEPTTCHNSYITIILHTNNFFDFIPEH